MIAHSFRFVNKNFKKHKKMLTFKKHCGII
nr:MAG TPA: hypothetical protein [Caudoviricetes sp.]